MKKWISLGTITTILVPTMIVISCGSNKTDGSSSKDSPSTTTKDISTLKVEELKELIIGVKAGSITSFTLLGKKYNIENDLDKLNKFINDYFPTLVPGYDSTIIDTGYIDWKTNNKFIIPKPLESFSITRIPNLPEYLHWKYSSDDLYMDVNGAGVKTPHWTNNINFFRAEDKTYSSGIKIKAKIVADFGYLTNNKTIYELNFIQ